MGKNNNEIENKLISIDDKFGEIEIIAKTITFWVKERDYELIPIINILNDKIGDIARIIRK